MPIMGLGRDCDDPGSHQKEQRVSAPRKRSQRCEEGRKRAAEARAGRASTKTAKSGARAATNAKPPKANEAVPKPATTAERRGGQGGRRLADAFDAVSRMPALAESRARVLRASDGESSSPAAIAEAIESDVALTIAVMRAAGDAAHAKGSSGGVRQAIDVLGASGVREVVASIETYDPFESPNGAAER